MKLLFPIFASLMLQYRVNTEFVVLRRCLMGFGKCKNHCSMDEKEVQKCGTKKKCCIGPKVIQMFKNYIQNEMSHAFEDYSQGLPKSALNSRATQKKHQSLSLLTQSKSAWPFENISITSTPNSTTGNSATNNPMFSRKFILTGINGDTNSRTSAAASPPPAPPP